MWHKVIKNTAGTIQIRAAKRTEKAGNAIIV